MKQILFSLCLLFCIHGIAQPETITLDGHTFNAFDPPNMIRISNNFYADQTEITNLFYKEYLHWLERVYGMESPIYLSAVPDASVWMYQDVVKLKHENYFLPAPYDDYPVVGISLDQAISYAKWRTDRVAEMLLMEQGYLNPQLGETAENHFTINRFANGLIPMRKELDSHFTYPVFTVPSKKEWEQLAGIPNGENEHQFKVISSSRKSKMSKKKSRAKNNPVPTLSSKDGEKNRYNLYHISGNVAEMIDEPGIAMGGDWKNGKDRRGLMSHKKQNIPNSWTGFRCVASFNIIKMESDEK
ncbi:MAG: SUMF1/EgtB/PvdO family nonheme iron enzyme [Bacteroidota bacterium]